MNDAKHGDNLILKKPWQMIYRLCRQMKTKMENVCSICDATIRSLGVEKIKHIALRCPGLIILFL